MPLDITVVSVVLYYCSSSMPPSLTTHAFLHPRFSTGSGWRCRCGGSVKFFAPGYDDGHRFQHAGEACRRLSTGLRGNHFNHIIPFFHILVSNRISLENYTVNDKHCTSTSTVSAYTYTHPRTIGAPPKLRIHVEQSTVHVPCARSTPLTCNKCTAQTAYDRCTA